MEKQVIVTGGAGYIGSHTVVELIAAGFTPIIVDDFRNSEEFILDRISEITGVVPIGYRIDCSDELETLAIFQKHSEAVGVIHFAAYKAVGESVKFPQKYFDNNVGSMLAVLNAMKETGVQNLVFSSSCTVYGEPDQPEVTEKTPVQKAASPYGETKIICEKMIQKMVDEGNTIRGTLLRYFNPIGAHPTGLIGELPLGVPNNLVPFITQTAQGIRDELVVFGNDYDTPDGTNIRDYIHVVDLAKAHVAALNWSLEQTEPFCDAFNLGTGKGSSVLEIIHTFEEVNDLKLNYRIGERRDGDVVQIFANTSKAKEILGWDCQLSIADALRHSGSGKKDYMLRYALIALMICTSFVYAQDEKKDKDEKYKYGEAFKRRKPGIFRLYTGLSAPDEDSPVKFDRFNTAFFWNSWLGETNGVKTKFYAIGHDINLMFDVPFGKHSPIELESVWGTVISTFETMANSALLIILPEEDSTLL